MNEDSPRTVRAHLVVWSSLVGLLILSFGSAYLKLGMLNSVLNLVIATGKALLVMAFFMHLDSSRDVLKIVAAIGFLWLAILIALSLTDVLAR